MQPTAFSSWTSSFRDLSRSLGVCMAFLGRLRVSVFLWILLWHHDGQVGVGRFAPPSGLGIARVSGLGAANSPGDRWLVSKRERVRRVGAQVAGIETVFMWLCASLRG